MANDWWKKLGAAWRKRRPNPAGEARAAGDAARDARDWPEAAARYRAYLDLRPDDRGIRIQLGHALKEMRDYDGAGEAYRIALEQDADDADLHLQIGHLAKLRGDLAEATYRYRLSHRLDGNPHAARELSNPELDRYLQAAELRLASER